MDIYPATPLICRNLSLSEEGGRAHGCLESGGCRSSTIVLWCRMTAGAPMKCHSETPCASTVARSFTASSGGGAAICAAERREEEAKGRQQTTMEGSQRPAERSDSMDEAAVVTVRNPPKVERMTLAAPNVCFSERGSFSQEVAWRSGQRR